MGGSITVIIREEDGKIHKMCRWTNSLPYFTKDLNFINKDKKHLKDYLKVFYSMENDYKRVQKKGGNYRFQMTDCYIPYSGYIAPIEYGLVLIDYQTEQIISCQGYSSLNTICRYEIENPKIISKDEFETIQKLVEAEKVSFLCVFGKENKK
jgi:hypothetical protein